MSEYVEFYRGEKKTPLGNFSYDDVINFNKKQLEEEHGFVQFAFPNSDLSKMQPDAASQPFTEEAAQEMQGDPAIMERVRRMVEKMLGFWGMEIEGASDVTITDKKLFVSKIGRATHNQSRMTRLLIFLKTMGFAELMDSIRDVLIANVKPNMKAVRFWMAM